MFIQLFDQYTSFFQRNRAFFLCCGYKEGIPQSSTKTSSRQSIVLFSLSIVTLIVLLSNSSYATGQYISCQEWKYQRCCMERDNNEIRWDADYLFKIIGKAYAMLSDPTTVCITEISFIFFLCSCYWCCIFLLSFYQNFHVKWVGIILDEIYPAWCC